MINDLMINNESVGFLCLQNMMYVIALNFRHSTEKMSVIAIIYNNRVYVHKKVIQ